MSDTFFFPKLFFAENSKAIAIKIRMCLSEFGDNRTV